MNVTDNRNPMRNDAIYESTVAAFGDVLDYMLGPDENGDQDHWPYQVVLRLPTYGSTEATPELLSVISTVSSLATSKGWRLASSIPDDNSAVVLTVTLPGGWPVEDLENPFGMIVELAHLGHIDIGIDGKPIPPFQARVEAGRI